MMQVTQLPNCRKWSRHLARQIKLLVTGGVVFWPSGGVCHRCISGEEVIVPRNSTAVYTASPENRKSISIIKTISAAGATIPSVLILLAKLHMESWDHDSLQGDELLLLSESGYTNEHLAMEYLRHFIQHTKAGLDPATGYEGIYRG
jgi:hypothetical protein